MTEGNRLQLGWSTLGLPRIGAGGLDVDRALDRLWACGFEVLEIHLTERAETRAPRISAEQRVWVEALVRGVRARGGAALLGLGGRFLLSDDKHRPTLFDADDAGREARIALVAEALELAAANGLEAVIALSGPSDLTLEPTKRASPDWARWEGSVERLLTVAERERVVLAFEGHARHLFSGLSDFEALRARWASKYLGFTADTVHQTLIEARPLDAVYADAAGLVRHVQLDNLVTRPRADEDIVHTPITAAGGVDNVAALRGLRAGGYAGAVAVEFLALDHPEMDPFTYCGEAGLWLEAALNAPRSTLLSAEA